MSDGEADGHINTNHWTRRFHDAWHSSFFQGRCTDCHHKKRQIFDMYSARQYGNSRFVWKVGGFCCSLQLVFFKMFLQKSSYFTENKILRKAVRKKKSYNQDLIHHHPAASRSRGQKNTFSLGAAIYGALLIGTYHNFSSYCSCQI